MCERKFASIFDIMDKACYFLEFGKYLSIASGHWNFDDTSKFLVKTYKNLRYLPLLYWILLAHLFVFTALNQIQCKLLFLENMFNYLHCFINFMIIWLMRTKQTEQFLKSMKHFENVTLRGETKERVEIYMKYAKNNNNIGKLFYCFAFIAAVIWYYAGLHTNFGTSEQCHTIKNAVFQILYPFDTDVYRSVVIVVDVSLILGALTFFTYAKIITITMAVFITARLKMIQSYLKDLDKSTWSTIEGSTASLDDRRVKNLKAILKMHQEVINLMAMVQEASHYIIMILFYGHMIDLPSIIVQILFGDRMLLFRNFGVLIYTFVELFVVCNTANDIIIESTAISNIIYTKTDWITYLKRDKMLLQMMMLRSQRPLRFVVPPIGEISLETFKTLIRLSYSITAFVGTIYN